MALRSASTASRASCRSDSTRTPWSRSVNAPPNPDETAPDERQGFWKRFSKTLEAGRQSYVADLKEVFGRTALDDTFWDDLEATLIAADVGVPTTERVVADLRRRAAGAHLRSPADALRYLKDDLGRQMGGQPRALNLEGAPAVILVVGVNGSGKTTTIGKLSYLLRREGRRPLLAAADTYRAAAIEQLRLWGQRAGVDVVAHQPGSDPGAVAFDAVQAARARRRSRHHRYRRPAAHPNRLDGGAAQGSPGAGAARCRGPAGGAGRARRACRAEFGAAGQGLPGGDRADRACGYQNGWQRPGGRSA